MGQIDKCLQQECRFSDSRITADQYDASRYQSAPQHTVEFADARIETRNIDRIDIRQ